VRDLEERLADAQAHIRQLQAELSAVRARPAAQSFFFEDFPVTVRSTTASLRDGDLFVAEDVMD
jgi:hypothetical protein